ncbi:plastocyanin/azurin family copper-binding protein [Halegenticoccus tardaugens]|uniref:plastocyanin/azurin family copper-binding protein n=1 Tax=Halegenticoccus tardaugens TaxID=2071624 RepID=UPI00100B4D46|nr:plastocyanin/azurin family copper-binding protein [Halegenticoccus tardaugens]
MTDGNEDFSRRTFLRSATVGLAAAGAAATAAAQEGNESGGNESGGNESAGNESGGNESSGNESSGNESSGNESGGNESGGNESGGGGGGGGGSEEVIVGPGGDLVFDPEDLEITPGTTVTFVWESDGHNVVPNEGDWGHENIENSGFEYEHTFEEEAEYEYVCTPHESAGMVGTIAVSEDAGGGGGGGGAAVPTVPNSAKSLGVATTFAMVTTLGLAYFFIKYGGDYDVPE